MNKKGMTPIDMRLLLTLLEAIERICTYKKGKSGSSEKSSHKSGKEKKCPGTKATIRVPTKTCFKKHCDLCKKHGGTYTMHHTCYCCRFEKDGKEKSDFRAAKKGGKKGNVGRNMSNLRKPSRIVVRTGTHLVSTDRQRRANNAQPLIYKQ
jgi:hypothetical protein